MDGRIICRWIFKEHKELDESGSGLEGQWQAVTNTEGRGREFLN